MSGSTARKDSWRWLTASWWRTNGENPKSKPPREAAGHPSRNARCRHPYADSAVSAGAAVSATFRLTTGPNSQVTGASGMPRASTLVLSRRLMPAGTCTRVARNKLWPWLMAYAGQDRNHANDEGSPQSQTIVEVG